MNGYAAVGLAFFILVLGCFAGIGFKAEQFLCILAFLELQQHHSTLLFPAVLSSQVFKTDLYANICCFGQGYCDVSYWGAFFSCTNLLPTLELCLEVHTSLTLAELYVLVLTSFIKLIKLLQNLIKLLLNHIMV